MSIDIAQPSCYELPTMKKIAILSEPALSTNGLPSALRTMFPESHIISLESFGLSAWGLDKIDLLVLPGCNGETSPYPALLNRKRRNSILSRIKNHGMGLLTFCAASYMMMDDISYHDRTGNKKSAKGLGWIRGHAFHAFRHITRDGVSSPTIRGDYIEAKLVSPDLDAPEYCLNVNGPAFELTDDDENLCDVFLRYADVGNLPAGMIKKIGDGFILALGVHPELTGKNSDYCKVIKTWDFVRHDNSRIPLLNLIASKVRHISQLNSSVRAPCIP